MVPRVQRPKPIFPDVLTRDEISKLVSTTETTRDRALLMFLWDTGARISEAMDVSIRDLKFDRQEVSAKVRGKTGERINTLTNCIPDIQNWLNVHPFREQPDAPLWITFQRYGFGAKPLKVRTVQGLFKTLAHRAGILEDRVYPHAFRHARATDRAREGYTEAEMRYMFGWSATSNMPSYYVHLSGGDVRKKILKRSGMLPEEEKETGLKALEPVKCPRCDFINPAGAMVCKQCSLLLDQRYRDEVARMREDIQNHPEILIELLQERIKERANQ